MNHAQTIMEPAAMPVDHPTELPVLAVKDGRATTNSRDVAELFAKDVRHVHEAIRALIVKERAWGLANFRPNEISDLTGMSVGSYDMTRDGFTLLAMGFTGAKALKFKLAYIGAFNTMEARLKASAALPQSFADALQLAADQARLLEQQQAAIAVLEPKAEAFENLADPSHGLFTPTDTARALGVGRDELIDELVKIGWLFRKGGDGDLVGYATAVNRGFVDHRQHVQTDRRGVQHSRLQVYITGRGRQQLSLHYTGRPGSMFERKSTALPAPSGHLRLARAH